MKPVQVIRVLQAIVNSKLNVVPKPEDNISLDEAQRMLVHDADNASWMLDRPRALDVWRLAAIWLNQHEWLFFLSERDPRPERRAELRAQWEEGEERREALFKRLEEKLGGATLQ